LQDFAGRSQPRKEEINLEAALRNTMSTIRVPENVQINYFIEVNLKIKTDPVYLRRMITNLATNAIQAMPMGGTLTIKAIAKNNDKKVEITVEDTGEGIPEDAQNRVFTPLFTTKAKGQGFGLVVVKKFVEELGGSITFETKRGKGTKFVIEFPAEIHRSGS
jgi:signal transduction histidine kinase